MIVPIFGWRGRQKENAGEYSEEDTHRPVYCFPKVAVYRTFGWLTESTAIQP
jgi:hypothetical protein